EAATSETESAAEEFRNNGMNRALAEMQGARAQGRTPASSSNNSSSQALTTVALNITDDPRVSLSQILSDKINTNDPETQVLKVLVNSRKNFILQVNSVNFKVLFDNSQEPTILLESGNPEEATRLRP